MLKRTLILGVAILIACTSLVLAGPRRLAHPSRFAPALDRDLARVSESVDARTWAAWAYRNGAEFDIAVSYKDGRGLWSEPMILGLDDGRDQTQPAIAANADGDLYLAYADGTDGRIVVNRFAAARDDWDEPLIVSRRGEHGSAPALQVVAGHLIVAYRTERGTVIRDLELALDPPPGTETEGPIRGWIVDSGDPFGATEGGSKQQDNGDDDNDENMPDDDENNLSTLQMSAGSDSE